MRQRIDDGGVDREHRIEEMGEADAVRLGDEAEQGTVSIEAPRTALLHHVDPGGSSCR